MNNQIRNSFAAEERNDELYIIPNEGCCSPEFSEGCKLSD